MFRKSRPEPTIDETRRRPPSPLWNDPLGRAGIRAAQVLLLLIVVVAIVYSTIQLKLVVIPVLIALILASSLRPLVAVLERRMPDAIAALLALLLGVALFGGIITLVVVGVQSQFDTLQQSVSDGIDQVVDFVNNGPIPIDQQQIEDARQSVIDFVTSSQFGSGALAGVAAAIEVITGIVLGVFILFYFLKDGPRIWAFLIKPLNPTSHAKARRAGDRAVDTLGGYVRGTAIVALVDAVVIGGALVILQVPLALPLAIITFIGAFIPIIGATSAGILAALVALVTNDLQTALIVTIVVVAVNQLEGNFLAPVLLGKSLKLHELVVLLALTAGTILGGIVGTLLSVPLAGVAWTIIKSWNEQVAPVPGLDITDRDRRREVERRR
ncbi:MAG: conserved rane protein [Microbacteriaceae bacterium]|jgi:predicted PurR-regulated permease PerM|nr:conserved rane protein [Microbacteriaceae bacterium]